jgi:nucleoside-diphosphate-sugar epimerase
MKILITGNAGFVGRAYHRAFGDQHDITGIDIANGIDARDFFAKDDTHFDLVIHLAAVVGGRATIEGNPLAVATDLAIDSDLFQWALRTRPGRIIYYSSSAAYPVYLQTGEMPIMLEEKDIDLSQIRTPDFSYGWAKLSGEMLAMYARREGLKVTILRPFSGYGQDQDLDYPFPSFVSRCWNQEKEFKIWGSGKQVRDFIHIDDVVEGSLVAAQNDVEVMNLCSGVPVSFIELAEMMMDISGHRVPIVTDETKPVGVMFRVGEPTNMLKVFTPKISLEEGIARSFQI